MKAVTAKMFVTLAGVALAAPFLALAVLVGARALAAAHGTQDQLWLVALAGGGVLLSMLNGLGNRTRRAARAGVTTGARTRRASVIQVGY